VNRENEDLSQSRPEISAVEASLAQLRPRRDGRFVDEVKSLMKDALSDKTPVSENVTAMVKIPLTYYIRIAQFNAAAGGLLAGLFIGVLLGSAGAYFVMSRWESNPTQPAQASYAASSPHVRRLLEYDASLTPLEQALLDKLD
jgi:hypothetical protein